MAGVRQRGSSVHGALFLGILAAASLLLPPLGWPWYQLLPLLAYTAIVLAFPLLRRTAPPFKVGRLNGAPLASAVALCLATTAVLVAFHAWVRPDVSELATHLPVTTFGSLILAGVCFSVLNAMMEEAVFRGVLWGAIADEWNETVALVATAVVFGLAHMRGYPPGAVGCVLAGVFGLALGLLRRWAGGLALPLLCHVCADATIFSLIWWSGAFPETASRWWPPGTAPMEIGRSCFGGC